jgi:hypothetical protein
VAVSETNNNVYLDANELSFAYDSLKKDGHGRDGGDFEPECPACTAADKLKDAMDAQATQGGRHENA